MLRKFILAVLALAIGSAAYAASVTTGSNVFNLANVVANCGTPSSTYAATDNQAVTQDTLGNLCAVAKKPTAGAWNFAIATGGIVNTVTPATIKTAAGAGIKNTINSCQISADALGGVTELVILDGGSVIWRGKLQTTALPVVQIQFDSPLVGTANTALTVSTLTAVTGGVFVSCQGNITS